MDGTGSTPATAATKCDLEAMINALEQDMPRLQMHHRGMFALAQAWAERHDAILALVPPVFRATIQARLARIGIRWGLAPGARVTQEFRALGAPRTRRREG